MDRLVQAARAAWPGIDNPEGDFRAQLASQLDHPESDERVATSLWLAMACARGEAGALRQLETLAFAPARRALVRMGLSADAIEEAMQVVRERLLVAEAPDLPRLLAAAKHGDLPGIVRVAAVRSALNLRRKDHRLQLGDEHLMIELCPDDDPELCALKEQHRAAFKAALEQALRGLEPRERNVLRMHLLHGLSIDAIGATYQVHRATAARWLNAIRERLDDDTRRIIREREQLTDPEIDSLVRLVQSRIEVSFGRILDVTGAV
jgi:RNA polymerase sigma-70 factor, ECF subfamily